ncbi:MAG: LysR family transcriptional regulator [Pseudomonadota bacterium]|nr:LysR family transcriptional regulator [Pseudomonadota bacterium]
MSRLHARVGTLRQLEILLAVHDTGTVTAAAEALHLTQPTVSMQLHKLVDAMGVPLYEQHGRKLRFTDAGLAAVASARRVMEEFEHLDMTLADLRGLKAGTLRLSVVTTAKYFVPHLLGPFCERYPGVEVSFHVGNREQIIERLEQGLDDFYVFSHVPGGMPLESSAFLDNPLVAIASENHALARHQPLTLDDIAREPFLMRESGSGTRHAIEQYLQQQGKVLNVKMTVESNEAIRHSVMAGLGISILSAHTLNLGGWVGLVPLKVLGLPIVTQWYLVRPSKKRLSVVARAFQQFMDDEGRAVLADFVEDAGRFVATPDPGIQ